MKKKIAILAFIITIVLFVSVLFIGNYLNNEREKYINNELSKMYSDFNSIQILSLIIQEDDDKLLCISFESKLKELDTYIWELGNKIDKYRIATEEFRKDKFYLEQKTRFNENEIFYYLMMKNMIKKCNITKETVLFFYQNSDDCRKCDDQSFVLNDVNKLDDDKGDNQIAIFSFDVDLNVSSVNEFSKYYELNNYPCIVFSNQEKLCGIQDKDTIIKKICEINPNINICLI